MEGIEHEDQDSFIALPTPQTPSECQQTMDKKSKDVREQVKYMVMKYGITKFLAIDHLKEILEDIKAIRAMV